MDALRKLLPKLAILGLAVQSQAAGTKYLVFDTGVNFDPDGISQSSCIAGGSAHGYYWSSITGTQQVVGFYTDGSFVEDVNSAGIVVGSAYQLLQNGSSRLEAFRWTLSGGTQIVADFQCSSDAFGINDLGQIVGRLFPEGAEVVGFVWNPNGSWYTLTPKYGGFCGAQKINNAGEVMGYSECADPDFNTIVVWRPNGDIIDLGNLPDQHQNFGNDINDLGYVCGGSNGDRGSIGYLWAPNGVYSEVVNTFAPGRFTTANGVNNRNEVVGYLSLGSGNWKGYIRSANGTMRLLNNELHPMSSGWDIRYAYDINDRGQIAAVGYLNGVRRGVMLHPVKDRTPIGLGR